MNKKFVYKSELAAHTNEGVGYITRQHLIEEEDSLLIKEISRVVEGEEVRYCFNCGCEWLNIVLEGKTIFSTKRIHEGNAHEPLEERDRGDAHVCVECDSADTEIVKKTNFLDTTNGI